MSDLSIPWEGGPDEGGDPACWANLFERHDLATRSDVARLVRTFYRAAAMDDLLGPVFAAAHVDWPEHLATVTDFWMWQLLGVRGYEGNPLRAHEPVNGLIPFTDAHFDRWLALFAETVDEHFEGTVAELAKARATKMAQALARLLRGEADAGGVAIEVLQPRAGDTDRGMPR
jgi:hemoglobin